MHDDQKKVYQADIEQSRVLKTMTQTEGWKTILWPFLENRKDLCLANLKTEIELDMIRRLQVAIAEIEYIEALVQGVDVSGQAAHTMLTQDAKSAAENTTPGPSTKNKE